MFDGIRYAVQVRLNAWQMMDSNDPEYLIARTIHEAKVKGALAVFDEIYKIGRPVVVDVHLEEWMDFTKVPEEILYRIHYRLIVTQDHHIRIPVFIYENHEGKIEWKCPGCGIINPIEATFCGERHSVTTGCNRPREKTVQEMRQEILEVVHL